MYRIYLLLALCVSTLFANAQESIAERIDSLYEVGFEYLNNNRYPTALRQFNDALKLLENNKVEYKDKVFVKLKSGIGRCYWRMKQEDNAIATAREYVEYYAKNISDNDLSYASYMDNLSLYLINKDAAEALTWNIKAVELFRTLKDADDDLNVSLIRQAEIYSILEKPADAIKSQMQALLRIKILFGEHSDKYLDELPYQIKYYEQNGEQARADKLKEKLETLKEEAKDGYVPTMIEFTAESTHKTIDEMHMCCRYLLNHKLDAPRMNDAIDYVMGWSASSADVNVGIGDEEANLMQDEKFGALIVAYIASCCQYGIENRQQEFTPKMYVYGYIGMLNYYSKNIDITGRNEMLDAYLKVYEDSGYEKLAEKIEANFPHDENNAK